MKTARKYLLGLGAACLMTSLANAKEPESRSRLPEETSRENGEKSPSLDLQISELSQRLNAQVDASIGNLPTAGSGPKIEAPAPAKDSAPRPLYVRRLGISGGTRVEWVPPAPEKIPRPAPAVVAESTPVSANLQPYLVAAESGDARAMDVLGLIYHQGEGVPRDLLAAHDWYMKAAAEGDGDAINNLATLYWSGFAGRQNRKIAYVIFLHANRSGDGTDRTRARAQRALDALTPELSPTEIQEALSYTWPYVRQVVRSRGTDFTITPDVLPAEGRPRIRDNGWWQESERAGMTFSSPAPWDVPPGTDKLGGGKVDGER